MRGIILIIILIDQKRTIGLILLYDATSQTSYIKTIDQKYPTFFVPIKRLNHK